MDNKLEEDLISILSQLDGYDGVPHTAISFYTREAHELWKQLLLRGYAITPITEEDAP